MSPHGNMPSKKASNSPGLCPVKGQIPILFFGPCIFNNEDEKINQQNAQINSGLIYY